MILLNPKKYDIKHSDKRFQQIILKTIDFFENKGLKKIKDDDHQNTWYSDFLEFVKKEEIFATRICSMMIKGPSINKDRFKNIWENYVYTLKDQYVMNE